MRVFVLCTGRCGSLTFARAMAHASNFTAAHESRAALIDGRLDYPDRHIEVDNRLAWFLGPLGRAYPDGVHYVHLTRDPEAVARSYAARSVTAQGAPGRWRLAFALARGYWPALLTDAFGRGVLLRERMSHADRLAAARLMVDTVTANIEEFLRDRPHHRIDIADAPAHIDGLWDAIGAEGDIEAARATLTQTHNASP